ncbi:hypothetical protein RJ639_043372 [Escallonia herrerae]|uniref:Retrotransposon gag domain-containing protein n=1 Tax=Escallonia herrerae TaxID=1293975 RepID=A0AA88WCX2_9ASTE|nr:hypothetical protein RJ639_043372 [Escallonia herrerae]
MRSELEALGERMQWTVASQVELIFNRLDDLEVDSRLTMLEQKVDVFAEELDDLIGERVAHFTKWEPRGKKMLEPRSYGGTKEARQMDNLFLHLERYFEALDIDDEKEKVQTVVMYLNDTAALRWRRHYTDGCDVKTWEKFKHKLKRQFYLESVVNIAMINLRRLRQKGSICSYVKVYSAPEISERQQLCFFIDGLQQWGREPHDLASAMAIIERLEDFKQRERSRSLRHECAKSRGDRRLKSDSPKAIDDERSGMGDVTAIIKGRRSKGKSQAA